MILSLEGDMENATGGDFFYTHIYRIIKATNPKTGWPNNIVPMVRLWALELVYTYLIRKKNTYFQSRYIYIYIYPCILNIPFEAMLLVIKVIKLLPMKFFLWLYFITLELPGALFPCLLWFFHSLKIWIFLWYHHSWYQTNWQLWRIKHHFNPAIISLIYFVNCLHIFVI